MFSLPDCDICGAEKEPFVQPLRKEYQTKDIKNICEKCLKEVDAQNDKLLTQVLKMKKSWIKRFMTNLKASRAN